LGITASVQTIAEQLLQKLSANFKHRQQSAMTNETKKHD